jgi:hypothetical protein
MNAWDWLGIALVIAGGLISITGIGIFIGVPVIILGTVIVCISRFTTFFVNSNYFSGGTPRPGTTSSSSGILYSGRDHDKLTPGSFEYYNFELRNAAILSYNIESLTGESINVILTTQDELERFDYRRDIRILSKGSEFGTAKIKTRTQLSPAKYAIIVDNTGRGKNSSGNKPVEFEIEYEVSS